MAGDWAHSAKAWIAHMSDRGGFGREWVLDTPMLQRVAKGTFAIALDVGCGEGRFSRMLSANGIRVTGIDPTEALIVEARRQDPHGDYRIGRAEQLEFQDGAFDLVVSYLTLIDIPDLHAAIAEMVRVLRPGGTLLIANLNGFNTAGAPDGWREDDSGRLSYCIDNYLEERAVWVSWRGIQIRNWHRPLSTYMSCLLETGLMLRHFAEPAPQGGDMQKADRYRRVPYFHIMEWLKPIG